MKENQNTYPLQSDMRYDPISNDYVVYESIEQPKVELNLPLYNDNPIDISSWARKVSSDGVPIVKNNLNYEIINNNPKSQNDNNIQQETTSGEISLNISDRQKKAMSFLTGKGLDIIHAAGIVGNLMGESNLDHNIVNKSSGAYGICQWLGSRKKQLFNKYGNKPTFEQQLEFLWEELNTTEKSAFKKLKQTKTLESATDSFMRHFERPSNIEMAQSISRRLKFARSMLK